VVVRRRSREKVDELPWGREVMSSAERYRKWDEAERASARELITQLRAVGQKFMERKLRPEPEQASDPRRNHLRLVINNTRSEVQS
jgi:hypothetical protein